MAFPEDEEYGTKGAFQSTNLADPNAPNTRVDLPGGGVINYAPAKGTPTAGAQRREYQIDALMPKVNIPPPPNPNADRSGFVSSFGPSGLEGNKDAASRMREHQNALAAANEYLKTVSHVQSMRDEIGSKLDTADFLKEAGTLDHRSDNFESAAARLFAKYPKAAGNAVSATLTVRQNERANWLHGQGGPGANEFTEGSPEREAYLRRFHQTGNPLAAKAHATNVQKNEETLRTLIAAQAFDPNDLTWQGGKPLKPEFFNEDATLNYPAIQLHAAKKLAESSKAAQQQVAAATSEEKLDLQTIQKYSEEASRDDPDIATIYEQAKRRQAARDKARGGPAAAASAGPASAKRYSDGL